MRTIRVIGRGQLKVRPDTTRITMTLEGLHKEYSEALSRSAQDTERLRDALLPFGFDRSDLKTLQFGVDPEYESYQEKDGIYRQRFAGYRFRHTMKLEFPSDNERLGKILYALANGEIRPELRLSYTVRDPEAVKNALLAKAVADAKEKAAVLTRAAGVTLLQMQSIDYSWGESDLECRPMNDALPFRKAALPAAGSCALDIEPDEIPVSDTVTLVWEIS